VLDLQSERETPCGALRCCFGLHWLKQWWNWCLFLYWAKPDVAENIAAAVETTEDCCSLCFVSDQDYERGFGCSLAWWFRADTALLRLRSPHYRTAAEPATLQTTTLAVVSQEQAITKDSFVHCAFPKFQIPPTKQKASSAWTFSHTLNSILQSNTIGESGVCFGFTHTTRPRSTSRSNASVCLLGGRHNSYNVASLLGVSQTNRKRGSITATARCTPPQRTSPSLIRAGGSCGSVTFRGAPRGTHLIFCVLLRAKAMLIRLRENKNDPLYSKNTVRTYCGYRNCQRAVVEYFPFLLQSRPLKSSKHRSIEIPHYCTANNTERARFKVLL